MKVKVIKPVTLTLRAGDVVEIDVSQLPFLKGFVKEVEEKKKTNKKEG